MRRVVHRVFFAAAMALALWNVPSMAGPKLTFNDGKSTAELYQTYQLWAVGSVAPADSPQPARRVDLMLRRARLGLRGAAWSRIDYSVQLAFDNISKDPYSGTFGKQQKLENNEFRLWELILTLHIDSTWANLSGGLMRPRVSREFNNAFSGLTSLEFANTFYYLRDALVTRPTGRELGLNLGGQKADSLAKWGFGYDLGVFDAVQDRHSDLEGSLEWSPLVTGRLFVSLGRRESALHQLTYDLNHFGARNGVTLGVFGAWQGRTDELYDPKDTITVSRGAITKGYKGGFAQNDVWGADVLVNFHGLTLDGEYSWLYREFTSEFAARYPAVVTARSYTDHVWHVRGAYAFELGKSGRHFIEPVVMYTSFFGGSHSILWPGGRDDVLDVGLNWYVNKNKLKVSAHYLRQDGQAKSMFSAGTKNGVYRERDDYLVLAFQLAI